MINLLLKEIKDLKMEDKLVNDIKLCACGCGKPVLRAFVHTGRTGEYNTYLFNHGRIKRRHLVPCACGCGQLLVDLDSKGRLRKCIRGHYSAEMRAKNGEAHKGKLSPLKGRHHTDESRKKMRLSHLGKPLSLQNRINISKANKGRGLGRHLSEETIIKIRMARARQIFSNETKAKLRIKTLERWQDPEYKARLSEKNKIRWQNPEFRERMVEIIRKSIPRGEKANGWRGGLSFIPYNKDFNKLLKEKIRDRDNHICQLCKMPEIENCKSLTIHHIDYIKEHSYDDNLISLCVSCNTRVNNNRVYWMDYFRKYLKEQYGYKTLELTNGAIQSQKTATR